MNRPHGKGPPRVARWLLHRLTEYQACYLIVGDLDEVYHHHTARGHRQARLWYWRQVQSCMPGYVQNTLHWRMTMFGNYLKSAVRNLIKNRLFTFISLVGLALAIGCFLVTFTYLDTMDHIDSFHKDHERIFYVNIMIERSGNTQLWGPTPQPLAPTLVQDLPQVESAVRLRSRTGVLEVGDKALEEHLVFTDPSFLDLFTFPLLDGERTAFEESNAIFISDAVAQKYFGEANPLGTLVTLKNASGFKDEFVVRGVVQSAPRGSSIAFDVLVPYGRIEDWEATRTDDWGAWTQTFIKVSDPQAIDAIQPQMGPYVALQNATSEDWKIQRYTFQPVAQMLKNSHLVRNSQSNGPPSSSRIAMFVFGFTLVFMACLNYINIGIVTTTRRLREIGVRKVLGSNRARLIAQFLSENILLCLVALILGALLAGLLLIPGFNQIFGAPLKLDLLHNARLWLFFLATLTVTALMAGGYPALYVSRFRPVDIFRRQGKVGGGSRLTRFFLGFQVFLAFIMLSSGVIFVQNAKYQRQLDWGYGQNDVIGIPLKTPAMFEKARNALAQLPHVVQVSGSVDHVGRQETVEVVKKDEQEYEVLRYAVDAQYLGTLQLRLQSGRGFETSMGSDAHESIVVTDLLVQHLGLDPPLGQTVSLQGQTYFIIGVLENFYHRAFPMAMQPVLFRLAQPDAYRFLTVRTRSGKTRETMERVRSIWRELFPDEAFEGFYQGEVFDWYFRDADGVNKLSLFVGFSALLIACMGLFGMVSIGILKRIKEVSIRKVLGATSGQIIRLLNRDLTWLLLVALVLAAPLSFLLMRSYLNVAYQGAHMPLSAWPFLVSALALVATVLLTVLTQLVKAARTQIVQHLKVE